MRRTSLHFNDGPRTIRFLAAFAVAAMSVTAIQAQDTLQNTAGTQAAQPNAVDALPPPNPPSEIAGANQGLPEPGSVEEARALSATQNAAYTMEQPNLNQSLVPPQPPTENATIQPNVGGRAELGIYMIANDGPGVRVTKVMPGGAAESAGIRAGDYLLAVGSETVDMPNEVANIVHSHKPGDAIQLRIWRNRAEQTVTANLQGMRVGPAQAETTVNRPVYTDDPVYYENNVVRGFVPQTIYRQYYYPNNYGVYGYAPYGYRYGWGGPYRGGYYGTPRFGYWSSPWGEGVNVGGFQFGWR